MDNTTKKKFKKLKSLDFNNTAVTLWIVKRKMKGAKATFNVLNVEIADKVAQRLKAIVKDKIDQSNHIKEYSYVTEDQDDDVLTLDHKDTDFRQIHSQINLGTDCPKVESREDLLGTIAYLIEIRDAFQIVAYTKVPEKMDLVKEKTIINMIFDGVKFKDLDDQSIFRIKKIIDFIYYDDLLFILNKANFERGLNFREGMVNSRDVVLKDFHKLNLIDGIETLRENIGENMRFLRKIAMIKNNGYYKNEGFIKRLIQANKAEKWGLKIKDNKILVTDENFDDVLTILNNDRLKSPITEETFDVSVKKPIGG